MYDNQILQQSLEKELALLEELNSLSLRKKDVLLKDDLDTLEVIVFKEEALSSKLRTINDACLPQVQFFLRGQNKEQESVKKITGLIDKVREKTLQLRRNNELNQDLLRDSLSIIQFTMHCISPPADVKAGVYGTSGKFIRRPKKTFMLDTRR